MGAPHHSLLQVLSVHSSLWIENRDLKKDFRYSSQTFFLEGKGLTEELQCGNLSPGGEAQDTNTVYFCDGQSTDGDKTATLNSVFLFTYSVLFFQVNSNKSDSINKYPFVLNVVLVSTSLWKPLARAALQ